MNTSRLNIIVAPQLVGVCGIYTPALHRIQINQECADSSGVARAALAHEYFHALHIPHFNRIHGTPLWFIEGSAVYFEQIWLIQSGGARYTYSEFRNDTIHRVSNASTLRSDKGTLVQYQLGFLAIDHLIAQTSETKVVNTFADYVPAEWLAGFGIRFRIVFGTWPDDFYDDFAAHRACGFPQPDEPCRTSTPAPAPAAANGRIVFSSNRDGNSEIYVMNADGSNQTRLTNHPGFDGAPVWAPDGQRIAFTSGRGGNAEIYVMNADGTGVSQLTDTTDGWNEPSTSPFSGSPAWSSDGQRIAFSSNRESVLGSEVYVMNADGTNVARLAPDYVSHWGSSPAWSPDGQRIAFSSNSEDGGEEIYVMNSDGSNLTRLTHRYRIDLAPAWSPDGSRIAFMTDVPDPNSGNLGIYVMNADGSHQTWLTGRSSWDDYYPAWSPDGRRIAFQSDRDGNFNIYVMYADGSNPTRLTSHSASDVHPHWTSSARLGPIPSPGDAPIATRVAQLERQVSALQDEASVQQTRIDALKRFLAALQSLVDRLAARVAALESATPQPQAP